MGVKGGDHRTFSLTVLPDYQFTKLPIIYSVDESHLVKVFQVGPRPFVFQRYSWVISWVISWVTLMMHSHTFCQVTVSPCIGSGCVGSGCVGSGEDAPPSPSRSAPSHQTIDGGRKTLPTRETKGRQKGDKRGTKGRQKRDRGIREGGARGTRGGKGANETKGLKGGTRGGA